MFGRVLCFEDTEFLEWSSEVFIGNVCGSSVITAACPRVKCIMALSSFYPRLHSFDESNAVRSDERTVLTDKFSLLFSPS